MGHFVLACNPSIDVIVRRSPRAKRLSLRVSRLDGRVTLTLPTGVSDLEGQEFLRSRSDWVEKALGDALLPIPVGLGAQMLVEGECLEVREGDRRSPYREGAALYVPSLAVSRTLKRWMIEMAYSRAREAVRRYEAQIGRQHKRLTLRDTRSRWGSCSSSGSIMLSWRLIMAPPEVFDYVVAHEVAHLKEMNHGAAFWATVADLMPDYSRPRLWLRKRGHELHRYRFD
jgi:predicted metal-dependent hydrolase